MFSVPPLLGIDVSLPCVPGLRSLCFACLGFCSSAVTGNGLKPALRTGGTGRASELREAFDVGGQVAKGFGVSPKGSEG